MKEPVPGRPVIVEVVGRYLPQNQFMRLCAKIPRSRTKYKLIFYGCRFMERRPCEICAIQMQDINFENQSIRMMMGKTNIITDVPVPDKYWDELMIYIEANRHTFVNGYIFPALTSSNDHVSTDTVSRYFRTLCDSEGISQHIPGKKSHNRVVRFYDLVHSGTTDLVEISDTTQGRIARRHTDERSIKNYLNIERLNQERRLNNRLCNEAFALYPEPK